MRIGIDFDNTIANYDKVFINAAKNKNFIQSDWSGNKELLKEELAGKTNQWQMVQGLVYGPLMDKAICFPGLKKFLVKAHFANYKIYIISHKTVFGHFDKTKTNLRYQALSWLKKNDFFNSDLISLNEANIFFCDDREKKINKINELELDFMIDDLNEIFENKILNKTKKILFSSNPKKTNADYICKNWDQISNLILDEKDNKSSLVKICNSFKLKNNIVNIDPIKKGGNSQVFKISDSNSNFLILKEYLNTQIADKPRLKNEIRALQMLTKTGKVPKIIHYDYQLNIIVLEYINGFKINEITDQNLDDALFFIEDLYNLCKSTNINYDHATEACLNRNELINQIEQRFIKLKKIKNKKLKEPLKKLYKLFINLEKRASCLWPKNNIDQNLNKKYLTFSPSDFGFHNAILNEKKELKFIDFEYFGLDDPVKLISDFLWHPGMKLNEKQKINFTNSAIKIFKEDILIKKRLNSSFSLYGLRWALIILNDFLEEKIVLWNQADQNNFLDYSNHLKVQLDKSMKIYNIIISNNMECNYVE